MLTEMEKDFEGYNRAVKAVMHAAEKGTLRGVRGPVANLIKTGDRYADEIYTLYRAGVLNGSDRSGTFYPTSLIRRSEAAAILIRAFDEEARRTLTLQ